MEVNANLPDGILITKAANLLLSGNLVAFPTETVYGIGATIANDSAIRKIFTIKNRPLNNPLLIHVSSLEQVRQLLGNIPPIAERLAEKFWPGPLAMILPASDKISSLITGGTNKVGFRMPANKVALELIRITGPLAATSANLSNRPSPTMARHVLDDLGGRIAAIIDAGPTSYGIESTIIDISEMNPKILRLGGVLLTEIEETIGVKLDEVPRDERSFYDSKVKIILNDNRKIFLDNISKYLLAGNKLGIIHNNYFPKHIDKGITKEYELDIKSASNQLFTIIRDAEACDIELLLLAPLPSDLSLVNPALLDRLSKLT